MYTKIYECLLDSSVWQESTDTRVVWLTLLLMMDEDGFVRMGSPAALARRANVTEMSARSALKYLEGPDPDAEGEEGSGARLERVSGGWLVVKGVEYRDMKTRLDVREQNRLRQRKRRERIKNLELGLEEKLPSDVTESNGCHVTVTDVTKSNTSEQNRTDYKNTPPPRGEGDPNIIQPFKSLGESRALIDGNGASFAEEPSLTEVKAWNANNLHADAEWVVSAYHEACSVGWVDWKNRKVTNWKSYFTGIWASKQNKKHERGSNPGMGDKGKAKEGGSGRGAASVAFALKQKLEGVKAEIQDVTGKRERLATGPLASDGDRAKRLEYGNQLKHLKGVVSDINRRWASLEVLE